MKFRLWAACLFIAISATAQKAKIIFSEPVEKKGELITLLSGPEGRDMIRFGIETDKNGSIPIFTRYDSTLKQIEERRLFLDQKNMGFVKLLRLKDYLLVFTSRYNKEAKTNSYYIQKVTATTLLKEDEIIGLSSLEVLDPFTPPVVDFILSGDSSRIMLLGYNPTSYGQRTVEVKVFNADNFEKEWETKIELAPRGKKVYLKSRAINRDGSGIALEAGVTDEKSKPQKVDGHYISDEQTQVFIIEKGHPHEAPPIDVDMQGKFLNGFHAMWQDDGILRLFALYKKATTGNQNGFVATLINTNTHTLTSNNFIPFSDNLLQSLRKDLESVVEKEDPGLKPPYGLFEVLTRANGSVDYILQYQYNAYGAIRYERSGIVNINLKDGREPIYTRLPKYQVEDLPLKYSGFRALTYNNRLMIIYNDEKKNVEQDIKERADKQEFARTSLVMAMIDENGSVNRSVILEYSREKQIVAYINECVRVQNNKLLLSARLYSGGLKLMIGTLELE